MGVHQPGPRLLSAVRLRPVQDRARGKGRKEVDASIALIPFIDFLIVLVVFLLMSFSSGELLAQPNLPEAFNAGDVGLAPIITVDAREVTLDGHRVADTATLRASAGLERIDPLVDGLTTLAHNREVLRPGQPNPGRVILQASRNVDYRVIRKVMFSAAQAGYPDVDLAVTRRSP